MTARPDKSVVAMRRPTLVDVPPMPSLPASMFLRRARREDAAALATLLCRAYASERWDAALAEREMFGDETVEATLVVESEGRLIATASLQVRPDAPERGLVRWVATDEDRRREGLARALVIGVLALAQQRGCREALLHTESDRLAAIALYLQLGFEPIMTSDAEREVWKQVGRSLRADDLASARDVERRWGALDDVLGIGLFALAGACIAFSLVGGASGFAGHRVHPDAVLLPLAAAIPLAGAGALFRLAGYAMRRHATGRWRAQWAAIGLPLLLAFFIWLSVV